MKKNVIISTIITIVINAICFITNLICAYVNGAIPLGIKIPGGEMTSYSGFGVYLEKIYSLTTVESGEKVSTTIGFSFLSLLLTLVLIFVVVLIIVSIIRKKKNEGIIKK